MNTPSKSLSVKKALEKLIDGSALVGKRMGVKELEGKRIHQAVNLLVGGEASASKLSQKQYAYFKYLDLTRKVVGEIGVVLSAVALGQTAVGNMKDRVRVELPHKLKAKRKVFYNEQLRELTELYFGTSLSTPLEEESQPAQHLTETSPATDAVVNAVLSPDTQQAYLTGDVYRLNIDDIHMVASSKGIIGEILLTDPYNVNATSFITVPISAELTSLLITQRPRFM